ncbi:patatin-like phospholipase family protein [bacterium]|nr:patatin-like phospholipase family protein [bacterium]
MKQSLESWLSDGPFTLALCSHFFGFYSHTAVLTEMYESPIFSPAKVSGTSAGALVSGALASGLSPLEFKNLLFSKETKDYWDLQPGMGLLAGKKFLSILQSHFVNNFSQTKIPLEVGVVQLPLFKMKFLSMGQLPESVLASCAVPLLFPPVKLDAKWYYDGGVLQKSGISPKDKNQRVLNIYLDRDTNLLKKKLYKNHNIWGSQHRIVYLPHTPRVNPLNLKTGQIAFEKILKRVRGVLKKDFHNNLISLD